jgi:hypothetical protein
MDVGVAMLNGMMLNCQNSRVIFLAICGMKCGDCVLKNQWLICLKKEEAETMCSRHCKMSSN